MAKVLTKEEKEQFLRIRRAKILRRATARTQTSKSTPAEERVLSSIAQRYSAEKVGDRTLKLTVNEKPVYIIVKEAFTKRADEVIGPSIPVLDNETPSASEVQKTEVLDNQTVSASESESFVLDNQTISASESTSESKMFLAMKIVDAMIAKGMVREDEKFDKIAEYSEKSIEVLRAQEELLDLVKQPAQSRRVIANRPIVFRPTNDNPNNEITELESIF